MEQHFETDFLVAGSGAGGMVAALKAKSLGLDVLVVEKSKYYGGSTAMSGGAVWAPNNRILKEAGITNTEDEVVTYLRAVTEGKIPEEKLRTYARKGPEMIDFLCDASEEIKFVWAKDYSDYHPEFPFGRKEGRSIEPEPFDLKKLGKEKDNIRPADIEIPFGMWLTAKEFRNMSMMMRTAEGFKTGARIGWRTFLNLFKGANMVALGQSLIGRLRFAMQEHDIPLWLSCPITDIIYENGRVWGAKVIREGKEMRIKCNKGLLLATGGFDHNEQMRKTFLPEEAQNDYSAGARDNVGDGIRLGDENGAQLDLMKDAWWMPSVKLPNGKMITLVSERAIPRSIIVGQNGRRFTNEASPYVNFVHDQIASGAVTAWQILDHTAINRYMYAGKPPMVPFPKEWYQSGIVFKADTLEELAKKINIEETSFKQEVAEFNQYVKDGKDLKFNRGESAYDGYYGDPSLQNPVLDFLNQPPFYAVKIVIGDIGTKGGLLTDHHSRVLDLSRNCIEGLYASGNVSASVMGNDYAGAGATIGPAMVFGYVAAEDAAKC